MEQNKIEKKRFTDCAVVYAKYIPSHYAFSQHAAISISEHVELGISNSDAPKVLSVCAYTPSFFYSKILDKATHDQPKVLESFANTDIYKLNDTVLNGQEPIEFQHAKKIFLDITEKHFSHFQAVSGSGDAVRLCVFSRSEKSIDTDELIGNLRSDDKYLTTYRSFVKPAHSYAFFRWLNGNVKCYILPPTRWATFGFDNGGRDFALLSGTEILEYHEEWNTAIVFDGYDKTWDQFYKIKSLLETLRTVEKYDWNWISFFRLAHPVVTGKDLPDIIRAAIYVEIPRATDADVKWQDNARIKLNDLDSKLRALSAKEVHELIISFGNKKGQSSSSNGMYNVLYNRGTLASKTIDTRESIDAIFKAVENFNLRPS